MPTLVLDKFSSLFGDERGLGLPPLTDEERIAGQGGVLTKYRVLGFFDDEDAPDFEYLFMRDVFAEDIEGFVSLELLSEDKVEFIIYAKTEEFAKIRFLAAVNACGYDPYVMSVFAV